MKQDKGLLIYDVSEFIQYLNDTLVSIVDPARIAVEGEVSSFNVSQGKWVRFDLKDENGLLNCFLVLYQLKVPLEDGMKVRVYGYPKVYPKYGKLSFTVQRVELVGEGALRRAYELLKKKLANEGLFAPERKRVIPRFPETIGLITSRESAACGDFLRILRNRWGGLTVRLTHVQVQGEPAVRQIVGAFRALNRLSDPPDVIVLVRGGGSLDELGAFNSEEVARAVFSSKVPVVVGVGHERDETIADMVADIRASTPTNAAELVIPDRRDVEAMLARRVVQMEQCLDGAVRERAGRLAEMTARLENSVRRSLRMVEAVIFRFRTAFAATANKVRHRTVEARHANVRLLLLVERWRARLRDRLQSHERLLKSLDPKAVLRRGYSIVFDEGGRIIKTAARVDAGDDLTVQLHQGSLHVKALDSKQQGRLPLS